MQEIGLTATALAAKLSLSKGTITHWTQGTNKATGTNLINLAKALDCDPDWLITGKSSKNILPLEIKTEHTLADKQIFVPLLDKVDMSNNGINIEQEVEDWIACPVSHSSQAFALRVRGDSMYNPQGRHSFRMGDIIYVDPRKETNNGSFVVANLAGSDEITFKQLVIEDGRNYLKALNPAWPTPIVEMGEEVGICGVVIGRFDPL